MPRPVADKETSEIPQRHCRFLRAFLNPQRHRRWNRDISAVRIERAFPDPVPPHQHLHNATIRNRERSAVLY